MQPNAEIAEIKITGSRDVIIDMYAQISQAVTVLRHTPIYNSDITSMMIIDVEVENKCVDIDDMT